MRIVSSRCGGTSASSTSSSTTCRTRRSETFLESSASSAMRPAVPTITCGLRFLYASSCRFTLAPPTRASADSPLPSHSVVATRAVWWASSLEGQRSSSCGCFTSACSWQRSGRSVARVFPEPVCAWRIASRPPASASNEPA
eukprot:scaffold74986_cov26-Tisochrysis_lutea.AAC.2